MFCKKCGSQIEQGAGFCKKCGTPVEHLHKSTSTSRTLDEKQLKIGMIAASILMIVSTILPFYKLAPEIAYYADMETISLLKAGDEIGDGVILIILAGLIIVFTCINMKKLALICSGLNLLCYCFSMFTIRQNLQEAQQQLGGYFDINDLLSKATGYYLMMLSAILLLIASILYFRHNEAPKQITVQ